MFGSGVFGWKTCKLMSSKSLLEIVKLYYTLFIGSPSFYLRGGEGKERGFKGLKGVIKCILGIQGKEKIFHNQIGITNSINKKA